MFLWQLQMADCRPLIRSDAAASLHSLAVVRAPIIFAPAQMIVRRIAISGDELLDRAQGGIWWLESRVALEQGESMARAMHVCRRPGHASPASHNTWHERYSLDSATCRTVAIEFFLVGDLGNV